MIINEKALVRLMKAAQKCGGYRVAMTEGLTPWIYILGHGWTIGAQRDKLPRKVLALLVEHMGEMPYPGMASKILRDTVQEEFFEVVTEPIFSANVDGQHNWLDSKMAIRPTPLTWRATQVWQRGDGKIFLVDPDLIDISLYAGLVRPVYALGTLYFDNGTQQVYITPETPLAGDEDFIKTIGSTTWTPGKESNNE